MSQVPSQSRISKVAFVSLGCPKNLVDSEKMLGTLVESGLHLVSDHDEADAIVINTCGFLEASRTESLEVIFEALERKQRGHVKRVVVAGCLVQRHRAKLLEWAPGVDAMIGVFDRDHILDAVSGPSEVLRPSLEDVSDQPRYWIAGNALQAARERGIDTIGLTVNGRDGMGVGYFEDDAGRFRLTPRHWAYLRVSEGCNQRCAFCTIPSIRGKMRSKPLDRIVSEARQLLADGAFEINLIGQDTTSYGYDIYSPARQMTNGSRLQNQDSVGSERMSVSIGGKSASAYSGDLVGLFTALNDAAAEYGGAWMRLMYVYPTHFTDEMIDAIAALPNIVKYIDIPLQHISDRMLSAMRRNITRAEQENLLYRLRERIPGLAIRTTFITGFPGETEQDHRELVEFVDEFGFDMMGVFRYSPEAGTPAGTLDIDPQLHVPDEIKREREAELMLTQQQIAFENAQYVAQQNCQFDVLIDGPVAGEEAQQSGGGLTMHEYIGRCYHQAPQVDSITIVQSSTCLAAGELVRCTIVDSDGYDLVARPTTQLERTIGLPLAH